MAEPLITINGVALSDPQAMTVRVALETFAELLATDGFEDDDSDRIVAAAYQARIREVREMMHGAPNGGAREDERCDTSRLVTT